MTMAHNKFEQSALSLLAAFENAGKSVSRVIVEGKRIEIVLSTEHDSDDFDRIDMRHGKT
tara:strand:- start:428 stop:607 length:180 start_codon:yes stop_codon:yes gene_type:complete